MNRSIPIKLLRKELRWARASLKTQRSELKYAITSAAIKSIKRSIRYYESQVAAFQWAIGVLTKAKKG